MGCGPLDPYLLGSAIKMNGMVLGRYQRIQSGCLESSHALDQVIPGQAAMGTAHHHGTLRLPLLVALAVGIPGLAQPSGAEPSRPDNSDEDEGISPAVVP